MTEKQFMIKSNTLDRLKKHMQDAAALINKAMEEKRPVWIRHHADADGYCGAVALERVILKKLYDIHRRESDIFHYYRRLPSRTPFYDYSDSVKDITNMQSEINRFGQKTPLIIVVDNGSSREDTLALKKLKVYNTQIIVVDHHPFVKQNDEFIDIHINPLLIDADPYVTAGMICTEIAHMIDMEVDGMELLAALAGIADCSHNDEVGQYLRIAQENGYTKENITEIAEIVDFEVFNIGYLESRFLVDDLLFGNPDRQKQIVKILKPEIEKKKSTMMKTIERYAIYDEHKDMIIAKIAIDSITHAGKYPLRGKTTSLAKEYLEKKTGKPVVALGYGKTFITFRISNSLDIDMTRIMKHLEEKLPYALIQGGGHPKAGTIKFIEASADEVLSKTIDFIKRNIK